MVQFTYILSWKPFILSDANIVLRIVSEKSFICLGDFHRNCCLSETLLTWWILLTYLALEILTGS